VRIAAAVSAGTALLLAAALLWHSAYAGFSDATSPLTLPRVSTGSLTLTDDDAAVRMFTAGGLKPGATATRCIAVTSTGSAATVRLYGTGRATTNGLAAQLTVTVTLGTGGSSSTCTGFTATSAAYSGTVAAFPTDSWTAGVGGWTTTGSTATTRTYKIVYALPAGAPTSAQNGTATLSFVWEARTR
jgi:hypothetical protein